MSARIPHTYQAKGFATPLQFVAEGKPTPNFPGVFLLVPTNSQRDYAQAF